MALAHRVETRLPHSGMADLCRLDRYQVGDDLMVVNSRPGGNTRFLPQVQFQGLCVYVKFKQEST